MDQYRKVRRDVINTINKTRVNESSEPVNLDKYLSDAATQYAEFCAKTKRDGDKDQLQEIIKNVGAPGNYNAIIGYRYLEDEEQANAKSNLPKLFIDAHGLTFEINETREEMIKPEYTHVGLGLALKDNMYVITELYSSKPLRIEGIKPTEDEKAIEISGKMTTDELGPYALRVYSAAEPAKNICLLGPESMKYNPATKEFLLYVDKPELVYVNPHLIFEVYLRNNPQKIPYQQPQTDDMSKQLGYLSLAYKSPLELYPDPRIQAEDLQDRAREEQEEHERQRVQ